MSFIVKAPSEAFAAAPEGSYPALCVDIVDLGMVPNKFEPDKPDRHMVRLVWQLDEIDEKENKPFYIQKDYGASLHDKATLRKDLEAWRGRAFTSVELFGFDLDSVLGAGCIISVVHNTGRKGDKIFANVGAVMKLMKGMSAPKPVDYVRVKDRVPLPKSAPVARAQAPKPIPPEQRPPDPFEITDDDVPF